ncbi:DNA translocase FtsK [Agrobacterium vitis]|uniref:DNA translocase FtsK n=1 Tax=Agrobacterium vitis TaxID=373 RepID=A0A6L6VGQ2_AGRVI|nr:DNA translocase FtsK [Agrobacterium vitis]MUZ74005.1 DNA translocase FtsK [Agrobacterium vitis]
MRVPTQNSPRSSDQSGHDDPQSGAVSSSDQGRQSGPNGPLEPWQSAFVLGPNVRFTRTPEAAINKRREAEAAAEQAAVVAALQKAVDQARVSSPAVPVAPDLASTTAMPASIAPESAAQNTGFFGLPKTGSPLIVPRRAPPPRPVNARPPEPVAEVSVAEPVQDHGAAQAEVVQVPQIVIAPQFSPETLVRPLPNSQKIESIGADLPQLPEALRLRQAAAAMRMAENIELNLRNESLLVAAAAEIPADGGQAATVVATAQLSVSVSDFAFFEMLADPFDLPAEVEAPQVALAPVWTPIPAVTPVSEPVSGSVAALYREIRVRHGAEQAISVPAPAVGVEENAEQSVLPAPVVEQVVELVAEPEIVADVAESAPVDLAPWEEPAQPVEVVPDLSFVEAQPIVLAPVAVARPVSETIRANRAIGGLEMNRHHPFDGDFVFPSISLLQEPPAARAEAMLPEALEQSAGLLESVLEDFGIRGEVIDVRPGPVVTLYEFEPAPGIKSSRIIGLADDIARSMSALSARVAVVPGRNVIGIELPNAVRETVYLRELIECEDYWESRFKLALCLGKSIGGEPVIAELAKMPHLLVAGTTGSGKSVAINTMILSLLYRLKPEECRLIMVDPKMLELSVYDGIPHLLTPVVTDPKKAVMALKWAVREMEDRYRKMSRLGVRNIDGYNARAAQAREKNEVITVSVQVGFDRHSGEILYEDQDLDMSHMPYIVIIVDEMADLMMVAGKEIEGAIQRLAQMARAAGIHLIMATQRPSVDVITGTIKANFPTRISFQVTSKIDSRTILGEQGAEHLLGQGDMLHMVGGGRVCRVHGPFVSDAEVEQVVAHLKTQGRPEYLGTVTEEDGGEPMASAPAVEETYDRAPVGGGSEESDEVYEKAVKVVLRDQKCSTSYIQRRLSIGYNRAASLVERMEREGLVGPANHVGKREIIAGSSSDPVGSGIGFDEVD